MELPILDWNDGGGQPRSVLLAGCIRLFITRKIATINQDSYLKRYAEGERLVVLLNDQPLL
ncbi:hypothetical protein J4727_14555 [Providencia rettgeri]|uniref:Uncharacterized protein n=1 Tax=Providencia rettgeri TaxID=587 RepID=A0A939NGP0_PRORE|nr:hypothetical protein [Providencia rettgeri]